MKIITTLFTILLFTSSTAFSQVPEHFEISGGIKINMPLQDLKETQKTGVGFDLQGEVPLSGRFTFVANTALSFFGARNSSEGTFDGSTVGFIPFLGGFRGYISNRFFIGAQAGYAMYQDGFLKGPSSKGFSYSPQIGFNGGGAQVYFYLNSTDLKKEYDFISKGNKIHIGGSIIYRGFTDFLY